MAPRRERHQVAVTEDLALARTLNQYILLTRYCTLYCGFGLMEMCNKVFHSKLGGWRSAVSVAYGTVKTTLALCFTLPWYSGFMVAPCSGTRDARLNLTQDEQLNVPYPPTQLPGAANSANCYLQNSLLNLAFQISPKPSLNTHIPGICLWPLSYGHTK